VKRRMATKFHKQGQRKDHQQVNNTHMDKEIEEMRVELDRMTLNM
jgi:hypothetical protein